jgi:hypothetical protein
MQLLSNKIQTNSVKTTGKEFFVVLKEVEPTENYHVIVHSKKLVGAAEYLILETRCRINQCLYNRVLL